MNTIVMGFLFILGKIEIILGYAQSPSSSINRHLKTTLAKDTGKWQNINQVIHKASRERPTFKFKVPSVKKKHWQHSHKVPSIKSTHEKCLEFSMVATTISNCSPFLSQLFW
jgi:hypothetical protein